MFSLKNTTVDSSMYQHTISEISHQPKIWDLAYKNYLSAKESLDFFLSKIISDSKEKVRVIFTGAGTSEYVGNIVYSYLSKNRNFRFESVATTNLVSNPYNYFDKDEKTLLVSFARSGNSPESLAAVELAEKLVNNIYHLAITCAPDGKLATGLNGKENAYVLLMPEGSNDKGFAMTSSFSSMLLSALLIFDTESDETKRENVEYIIQEANKVLEDSKTLHSMFDFDFERIIYLGSGPLYFLTNEARLKILELTAGDVSTMYESSLGFRHGPKSWVNDKTLVINFVSNHSYTKKYDLDILNEIKSDNIAKKIVAISNSNVDGEFEKYIIKENKDIDDAYLSLVYVVIAQLISIISAVRVGNNPDNPSKTGTVNRVVQGVLIHKY